MLSHTYVYHIFVGCCVFSAFLWLSHHFNCEAVILQYIDVENK